MSFIQAWIKIEHFPGISLKEYYVIFIIFTLEQIIVLNTYCTHNKPIPKISHVKTLQDLCKMSTKKTTIRK